MVVFEILARFKIFIKRTTHLLLREIMAIGWSKP